MRVHYVLMFLGLICSMQLSADIVGSNKTVTRVKASYVFPNNRSGFSNTILGFTYMEQGFALKDDTTTCTFDGSFPVKGNIALNGGTLYLSQNLAFSGGGSFSTGGTIVAARNKVILDSTEEIFQFTQDASSQVLTLDSIVLEVSSDLTLSAALKFTGNCTINCSGHRLYMDTAGDIMVGANSTLCIRNAIITNIKGTNIHCEDATSGLVLQNVTWLQGDNYSFDAGSLLIKHDVLLQGVGNFNYRSTQPCLIDSYANLLLDKGVGFVYNPVNSAINLLQFTNQTSALTLRGGTIITGGDGLVMKKGLLQVMGDSFIIASDIAPCVVGDNQTQEDMNVLLAAGAQLTLQEGRLENKNSILASWTFNGPTSVLRLNIGAKLKLLQTLDTGVGALYCERDSVVMSLNGSQLLGRVHAAGTFINE